jgi:hypothetical protein
MYIMCTGLLTGCLKPLRHVLIQTVDHHGMELGAIASKRLEHDWLLSTSPNSVNDGVQSDTASGLGFESRNVSLSRPIEAMTCAK